MGLILGPFSVSFLGPKTGPNSGPLFNRFWAPFWLQNGAQIAYKAPQKTSKRHRSTPRRGPSGTASAVLVLFQKATKTLYFTMVLVPPSCLKRPKTPKRRSCCCLVRPEAARRTAQKPLGQRAPKQARKRPQKDTKKGARN